MSQSRVTGPARSNYESLAAFRFALRRFLAFSDSASRDADVTPAQYQALPVIRTHPAAGIMIRELTKAMLLQHHGAVQLVDRMARAGLVTRRNSTTGRRSVLVALTRKGEGLLRHLAFIHRRELLRHERLFVESLRRLREIEY